MIAPDGRMAQPGQPALQAGAQPNDDAVLKYLLRCGGWALGRCFLAVAPQADEFEAADEDDQHDD
jgi:hypothetical protein